MIRCRDARGCFLSQLLQLGVALRADAPLVDAALGRETLSTPQLFQNRSRACWVASDSFARSVHQSRWVAMRFAAGAS